MKKPSDFWLLSSIIHQHITYMYVFASLWSPPFYLPFCLSSLLYYLRVTLCAVCVTLFIFLEVVTHVCWGQRFFTVYFCAMLVGHCSLRLAM